MSLKKKLSSLILLLFVSINNRVSRGRGEGDRSLFQFARIAVAKSAQGGEWKDAMTHRMLARCYVCTRVQRFDSP